MDIFGIIFGLMINAGLLIVLIFAIPDTVLRHVEYVRRLLRKSRKQNEGEIINVKCRDIDRKACA